MERRVGFVGKSHFPNYIAWAGILHLERNPGGRMSFCNRLMGMTANPSDLLSKNGSFNLKELIICKRCLAKAA